MTSSTNRASLIERLEAEDPFRMSNDGMTVAELPPPGKLRNPDGPEAAALIRELVEALEPFAREGDEYDIGDSLTYREGWREDDELADVPQFIRVGHLWRAATLRAKASQ